jgi:D-glycero-D-manno-heptose 1,7-bisphosphate phosphatase
MGNDPLTRRIALRRAVFLDRDGTLNRAYLRDGVMVPPASVQDFELLPGVRDALEALRRAGLCLEQPRR